MKSHYLSYLVAILQALMMIFFAWRKIRKEVTQITPKSRVESARFFTWLVAVLIIAFGLVVLLAVNLQKTSQLSPTLMVLANGIAVLSLFGALLLAFGLPAYNYVKDLEARCQRLEEKQKAIELDVQPMKRFLEEAFPPQQRFPFMDGVVHAETQDEYTS